MKNKIITIIGLIIFLLTFDAAIGSYQESEPHAGNILFVVASFMAIFLGIWLLKVKPFSLNKNYK